MVSKELPDDQLIHQGFRSNPKPAMVYMVVIAAVTGLLWGGASQSFSKQHQKQSENPFLQVTNREFSLFLGEFPEYMRVNVSSKTGYLPGFQYTDKIAIERGQADDYVQAPPEVIFLYHAWKRLAGDVFSPRLISVAEFVHFLEYCPEWHPENWADAPKNYRQLIQELPKNGAITGLPNLVQKAFIGWKNYFLEGDLINQVKPTYREMTVFLKQFPNYARNYWRNMVLKGKPDYLKSLNGNYNPDARVPEGELAAFLKVAYFNFTRSESLTKS